MSHGHRLLVIAALAFSAMLGASSTSVASFSVSPGGGIELVSVGAVTMEWARRITCNMTLRGRLDAGAATRGAQFGSITGARIAGCEGATIERALVNERERTWPVKFERFLGTQPNSLTGFYYYIENVSLRFASIEFVAVRCLYEGAIGVLHAVTLTEGEGGGGEPARYALESGEITEDYWIEFFTGGEECPESLFLITGTFELNPEQEILQINTVEAEPSSLRFGRINREAIARQTVTIRPEIETRVTGLSVRNGVAFGVVDTGRCRGATIRGNGTCTVTVVFVPPGEARTEYEDDLTILTNQGNVTVSITGGTS